MKTPLLSKVQFNKIKPLLPSLRGAHRLDDRLIISGILWVLWHGLPWRQTPEMYGKWNTVYERFRRWSKKGIFEFIFHKLGMKLKKKNQAMLDSTYAKVHRTAASLKYDKQPRKIGRTHGGITTKIHLLCNEDQMPLDFIITEGQVSDIKMASIIVKRNLGRMKFLIADKAYDSDNFREYLAQMKISACIPPKSNRKNPASYDQELYKTRHTIENLFAKLKDWRGLAMRYCRCSHIYTSTVALALITTFFIVH